MAVKRSTFKKLGSKFVADTFADFAKSAVINQLVTVDDGQGGRSESWVEFAQIRAFVFPLAGTETVDAGRYFTDQDFKFSFEPVVGVTTKMKIVYNGDTYGIISIKDIAEAGAWMEALTQKDSAQ